MGKIIDMTGQRVGKLVVIERAENNKEGRAMWRCKCDCGNEIVTSGKMLRSKREHSCGHCGRDTLSIDEVGKVYGQLTVLKQVESVNGRAAFDCVCSCGKHRTVTGKELRTGKVYSCKECAKPYFTSINEIGNKYGLLTVIESAGTSSDNRSLWKCKCECGNIVIATGKDLRQGKV